MQGNLESVFRNNDPDSFLLAAESLVRAENRYVIGQRGNKGTAAQFARLLSFTQYLYETALIVLPSSL